MKKWRIIKYRENYFPEHRVWGFLWWWTCDSDDGDAFYFKTIEEARNFIEGKRAKKSFTKEIIEVD